MNPSGRMVICSLGQVFWDTDSSRWQAHVGQHVLSPKHSSVLLDGLALARLWKLTLVLQVFWAFRRYPFVYEAWLVSDHPASFVCSVFTWAEAELELQLRPASSRSDFLPLFVLETRCSWRWEKFRSAPQSVDIQSVRKRGKHLTCWDGFYKLPS